MTLRHVGMALSVVSLAACGAGLEADPIGGPTAQLQKGGGGDPNTAFPDPLPSEPPAPDLVIRESFGPGPDLVRPHGGKGELRSVYAGKGLSGYWVEWPGSKDNSWITAPESWLFASCTPDPYELPSPLQTVDTGCTVSPWRDGLLWYPDALVPVPAFAGAYELSAEIYPAGVTGAYVAIGFTASGATTDNLGTSGHVWLLLRHDAVPDAGLYGEYEVRAGNAAGPVLASGPLVLQGYNPVALRYDPALQQLTARVNDTTLGPFDVSGVAPRYAVMEGQGVVDNFAVRALP